jgi:hypothetical protein
MIRAAERSEEPQPRDEFDELNARRAARGDWITGNDDQDDLKGGNGEDRVLAAAPSGGSQTSCSARVADGHDRSSREILRGDAAS